MITTLNNIWNLGQITHRDIKPANILILNDKFKLADFGDSKQHRI